MFQYVNIHSILLHCIIVLHLLFMCIFEKYILYKISELFILYVLFYLLDSFRFYVLVLLFIVYFYSLNLKYGTLAVFLLCDREQKLELRILAKFVMLLIEIGYLQLRYVMIHFVLLNYTFDNVFLYQY